jgi:hypothetical protein
MSVCDSIAVRGKGLDWLAPCHETLLQPFRFACSWSAERDAINATTPPCNSITFFKTMKLGSDH